jgi:myo-inositol-1-phosphate synthase
MVLVFDGNPPHLAVRGELATEEPCDVEWVLKESGTEMLMNFIPTESHQATRF